MGGGGKGPGLIGGRIWAGGAGGGRRGRNAKIRPYFGLIKPY